MNNELIKAISEQFRSEVNEIVCSGEEYIQGEHTMDIDNGKDVYTVTAEVSTVFGGYAPCGGSDGVVPFYEAECKIKRIEWYDEEDNECEYIAA